jgi:general secretion pathway protein C
VLKQNGQRCELTMFSPAKPTTPPPAAPTTDAPPTAPLDGEIERGIRRQSDTKYQVQRALVDQLLANQAKLLRGTRIVPQEKDGKVVGSKLYGIQRRSLLGKLGIQNGDTLRTINGFDMSSPDTALEARRLNSTHRPLRARYSSRRA